MRHFYRYCKTADKVLAAGECGDECCKPTQRQISPRVVMGLSGGYNEHYGEYFPTASAFLDRVAAEGDTFHSDYGRSKGRKVSL